MKVRSPRWVVRRVWRCGRVSREVDSCEEEEREEKVCRCLSRDVRVEVRVSKTDQGK